MTRLVQIQNGSTRAVALVAEPHLWLLTDPVSVYELAEEAARTGTSLLELIDQHVGGDRLNYDSIYAGKSAWRLLPPIDHPAEPARCLVSGTGLTHLGSAKHRQAMHSANEA